MRTQRLTRRVCLTITVGLLLSTGDGEAQACLGNSSGDGQGYLLGAAAFTDGAWAPGGQLGYNALGPIAAVADFSYTLVDNSDIAFARILGTLAAEVVRQQKFSFCPVAFFGYRWLANDGGLTNLDVDGVLFGGGGEVGWRLESGDSGLAFIPQLGAVLAHDRSTISVGGESVTGSDTFGSFFGAITLTYKSVFFGPGIEQTTIENADPVFVARLGVVF